MNKIRVVIIDDSVFMRKAIESMLANEPDIEIVGFGADGLEAVDLAAKLSPDVMTLDVEMPKMDGITALAKIMKDTPLPVIMVSSLTQEGADTTLKALDLGAVDFIPKDKSYGSVGILKIANELKSKIRRFAEDKNIVRRLNTAVISKKLSPAQAPASLPRLPRNNIKKAVAIGTSTGGPQSLQKVIPFLPADINVPVFVVQHMPPNFTHSLATRLNSISKLKVIEVQGGEVVQPNVVYIAKGGMQMGVKKEPRGIVIQLKPEDPAVLHNPSVDIMMDTISDVYGKDCLGVIMTGMGSDGTKGMGKLKRNGGTVISQDEASCVVYGMPRAVAEAGFSDEVVPLDNMARRIEYYCKGF